jgi:tetratricopeptide (TPR) repeat protein
VLGRLRELYGEDFQLEKDSFSAESPSELPSHPTLSERIQQLELFRLKAIEISKLFPLGREALDRGDYKEASLIFESILSLFPQSRTAHIGLGVAYHLHYWDSSQGDDFLLAYPGSLEFENIQRLRRKPDFEMLQRAIEEYQSVLSIEPGNKYASNNLGVALAELSRLGEAEEVLRETLRVDSQDFTLFNLGLVLHQKYQKTQQPKFKNEAIALIQHYLELAPYDQVAADYLQKLKTDD